MVESANRANEASRQALDAGVCWIHVHLSRETQMQRGLTDQALAKSQSLNTHTIEQLEENGEIDMPTSTTSPG